MKKRPGKMVGMFGVGLAAYFALYFIGVRTTQFESHDQIVPEPCYWPLDGSFIQTVFRTAHLIDAAFLRPARWDPRSLDRGHKR